MISPQQAHFLWRISWVSLSSSLYALYRGHYAFVPVPGGVFLTSINYWGAPDDAWRRKLDMTYVMAALLYQSFMAMDAEYAMAYYLLLSIALASYPIGWYSYLRGDTWMSVYIHSIIHMAGNVANIALYSGCILDCVPALEDAKAT